MTAETYAHALIEATKGKDAHEIGECVARLREILHRNGHTDLFSRIVFLVEQTAKKNAQKEQAEISVARKEDAHRFDSHIAHVRQDLGLTEHTGAVVRLDDTLIGGFRLRVRGAMVDATYKRALFDLYRLLSAPSV